jgi:hypothetical protein
MWMTSLTGHLKQNTPTHVRVCVHVNARAAKFLIHMRAGADAQRAGLVLAFDDDVLYLFFQTQN